MKTVVIRIGFKAYEYDEDGRVWHCSTDGRKELTSGKTFEQVQQRGRAALALFANRS